MPTITSSRSTRRAKPIARTSASSCSCPRPRTCSTSCRPTGCSSHAVAELARWVDGLDADARAELSLPIESVQLLIPIGHPRKIFLLAGNYAKHVAEGGGAVVPRGGDVPLRLPEAADHHADPSRRPDRPPRDVPRPHRLGMRAGGGHRPSLPRRRRGRRRSTTSPATRSSTTSATGSSPSPTRSGRGSATRSSTGCMGKWHDTFCPVGPCVLSADAVADPQALAIQLTVNGEVKQDATTAEMIFPVAAIVVVPLAVRDPGAGRHHRDRDPLRGRGGLRHLPQAGGRRPGDDRRDRGPGEPGRVGMLSRRGPAGRDDRPRRSGVRPERSAPRPGIREVFMAQSSVRSRPSCRPR